jgi:AcrR family transcriptional regulator
MFCIFAIEVKRGFGEFNMPRMSKPRKELLNKMMRESIFEAATSVLTEHGVNGITMNRVAKAANLTKSNIYNYFRDKSELLGFFNTRLIEPCIDSIEETVQSDMPAIQKLEKILRTSWEFCVKHKGFIRLLRGANEDAELRQTIRPRMLKMLTAVFDRGIQEGSFHPHNTVHIGRMLHGSLSELPEMLIDGASDEEIGGYFEALVDAVVNGVSIHVKSGVEANESASECKSR